ncbi:MAG: PQQ-binding-like beta-propeller repeat protein [Candidatus Pacebacteria bacterium]|nr:PQQ-binding-like beta-propeller repeat protein [Candidatus Paceibacterota bacterium]
MTDIDALKELIEKEVFVTKEKERIVSSNGGSSDWIFDFRRVLLRSETLNLVSTIFWEKFKDRLPFQVGGIEVAALPFIAGIMMKSKEKGTPLNGFFIRKSRKKQGLLRMIEGEPNAEKVILVDDLMNSGKSFIRQVEVLEALGKKVDTVFVILRFRDLSYYRYFHDKGIRVESLFTLDDFADSLKIKNLVDKKELPVPMPFTPDWYFKSDNPNYFYVVPKSAPALDDTRLFVGSDSGYFWALNQSDGSVAWKYKVGFHDKGKYIISSPAVAQGTVFFGAYDGNFYALDAATGKKKWIFMEADWVGSSPCVALDLGTVFVGLEFGLWGKRGGIAALDTATGKKKWESPMQGLTHSSPAYSKRHGIVVCGCNDNSVYAFDAKTGTPVWKYETGGEVKASFALDEKRGLVCFGSFDSYLYILKTKTGELVHKMKTREAIYSTPLVHGDFVYVASLDKNTYCIDLETGAIVWTFATNGRIFASPEMIGDKLYIGSNDGRLYELDAVTGKNTAFFQATERITNKIAYNKDTGALFLPTFANEIYRLRRSV